MSKIALVTSFPNKHWPLYAARMMQSLCQNWPKEIPLYIQLDHEEASNDLIPQLRQVGEGNRGIMVSPEWGKDQTDFMERNKGKDDKKIYTKQPVRFSHKVFALDNVANVTDFDYLIWYDADIETKKPITIEDIAPWLPVEQTASYMGRKDWPTSETGFIIFNMKKGGKEFIGKWREAYTSDKILTYPDMTDAYAFDALRSEFKENHDFINLTKDATGLEVFEQSPMAPFMEHHKGPKRKQKLAQAGQMHGQSVDVNNLHIVTKNCVDHEVIRRNVSQNLRIIPKDCWYQTVKEHKEEIVICAGGPSLDVSLVREFYNKGVKIVAVKHAVERLKGAGIKPWAVVLLDPRPHVSDFVEYPDKETIYFISSMVDPTVSQHLKSCKAKIIGYHAAVGAGEEERIPQGHFIVQGGSATSTRSISLFEGLGFKTMHLLGYDCCYFNKPDLNEKKDNGRLRYEELTIGVRGWGDKKVERTFWTEGQFLAQIQEFEKIYLPKKSITFHTYGEGMIPWIHRHAKQFDQWIEWLKEKEQNKCLQTLNELIPN